MQIGILGLILSIVDLFEGNLHFRSIVIFTDAILKSLRKLFGVNFSGRILLGKVAIWLLVAICVTLGKLPLNVEVKVIFGNY